MSSRLPCTWTSPSSAVSVSTCAQMHTPETTGLLEGRTRLEYEQSSICSGGDLLLLKIGLPWKALEESVASPPVDGGLIHPINQSEVRPQCVVSKSSPGNSNPQTLSRPKGHKGEQLAGKVHP